LRFIIRNIAGFLLCFIFIDSSFSQEVNKHISYVTIYDFMDELANVQAIELNTAIKPYSRKLIGEKLKEAETKVEKLTKRQKADLAFFLKDYNKEFIPDKNFKRRLDLFYYRDSLFSLTINPVLGYAYSSNANGTASHRWNGAELNGNIGKNFGFYFSLRDNGLYNVLSTEDYLTQLPGANYKPYQGTSNQRTDFDEARGGISCGWKWGSVSLLKDNFSWGNNYNGANIFSGRQPSFAYLNFKMKPVKWFEFNYVHGWLVSEVLDSAKTYGVGSGLRKSFYPKFVAANMFTFKPAKFFYFSMGNSIVYSDKYVQPVYLIPFMFYKSGDRTMNGAGSNALGENSQMFGDISFRMIPKTHVYASMFIDEVNLGKMFDKKLHTNLFSFKAGFRITNLIKNTSLTFEYTRTNPWVYVHPISTTSFESNRYNMGHYLGQNAEEIYAGIKVKPARGLSVDLSYASAIKGPVRAFQQNNGVNNTAGAVFIESISYQSDLLDLRVNYEIINDLFIFAEGSYRTVTGINVPAYVAPFYYGGAGPFYNGSTQTIQLGLHAGF
jgi:hypothetical protein